MLKKLFTIAAVASSMVLISCGGNKDSKELSFDKTIAGEPDAAAFYANMIDFSDVPATYSYEYVSASESGKAFDAQNWTIEICYVVNSDFGKDVPVGLIVENLKDIPLTADVLKADGSEILGQKDFEMTEEALKAIAETFTKGKGTEGKLVFTHTTNNKADYEKWFKEESASVRVNGKVNKKDSSTKKADITPSHRGDDSRAGYMREDPMNENPADCAPVDYAPGETLDEF